MLEQRPACIVLDEFQWLANYRREMVSDLKLVWEQYLSKVPGVKLILCGSIASFMTTKVVRSSALYGRTDLEIHLKEFQLGEAQQLLSGLGLDEVVEACLYFGGVPKYLELVRDHPSVRAAVDVLAFRENGYFLEEYDRIFTSHFGRNPDFRKIVEALAASPQGLFRQELARQAGVAAGGLLSEHLADLEAAGFVSSVVPFDKDAKSRLIKYYLSDPYLRFYFAFIRPNLRKIRQGVQPDLFARTRADRPLPRLAGQSLRAPVHRPRPAAGGDSRFFRHRLHVRPVLSCAVDGMKAASKSISCSSGRTTC